MNSSVPKTGSQRNLDGRETEISKELRGQITIEAKSLHPIKFNFADMKD